MVEIRFPAFEPTAEEKKDCLHDLQESLKNCDRFLNRTEDSELPSGDEIDGARMQLHEAMVRAHDSNVCSFPWEQIHMQLRFDDITSISKRGHEASERNTVDRSVHSICEMERRRKSERRRAGVWDNFELESETTSLPIPSLLDAANTLIKLSLMSWPIPERPTIRDVDARREKPCVVTTPHAALQQPVSGLLYSSEAHPLRRMKNQQI